MHQATVSRREDNGAAGMIRGLTEEAANERERSNGLVGTWQSRSQRLSGRRRNPDTRVPD